MVSITEVLEETRTDTFTGLDLLSGFALALEDPLAVSSIGGLDLVDSSTVYGLGGPLETLGYCFTLDWSSGAAPTDWAVTS